MAKCQQATPPTLPLRFPSTECQRGEVPPGLPLASPAGSLSAQPAIPPVLRSGSGSDRKLSGSRLKGG